MFRWSTIQGIKGTEFVDGVDSVKELSGAVSRAQLDVLASEGLLVLLSAPFSPGISKISDRAASRQLFPAEGEVGIIQGCLQYGFASIILTHGINAPLNLLLELWPYGMEDSLDSPHVCTIRTRDIRTAHEVQQ